jgi:hypothetical protein
MSMALSHCKADKPPKTRRCRECLKLEWEATGLRQKLEQERKVSEELQARIDAILGDRLYHRT